MDFSKANGSSKMLNSIAKSSMSALTTTQITEIDMSLIDENPDNEAVFNMNGISALANTIEKEGWTGAIEVIALPNGRYEISSGHRRYRAMQELGKQTIPCIIIRNVDSKKKARKLLSSNIRNRNMTPLDWGRAIRYYVENVSEEGTMNAKSKKECMEFFGFSESKISRYLALTDLQPELQKYVVMEGFPASALAVASKLTRDEQLELCERIEERMEQIRKDAVRELEMLGRRGEEPQIDLTQFSKQYLTIEINKLRGGAQKRSSGKRMLITEAVPKRILSQQKVDTAEEESNVTLSSASEMSNAKPLTQIGILPVNQTRPTISPIKVSGNSLLRQLSTVHDRSELSSDEVMCLMELNKKLGDLFA